jgi:hypothetical protein
MYIYIYRRYESTGRFIYAIWHNGIVKYVHICIYRSISRADMNTYNLYITIIRCIWWYSYVYIDNVSMCIIIDVYDEALMRTEIMY